LSELAVAPNPRRWLILAVVGTAFFMTILDVAIVNVAVPSIETDLNIKRETVQWVITAYAIAFGRFRGHRLFLSTNVALMVVPPVTLLVPMFVFMVDTGWVNHLQSVIVFYTGLLVPFAVFFLTNFFRTVPQELIEAASVEGAGPFTVLRRIVMPLSGAASFTLVIVQAIWVWNELLIALVFLQNEGSRTLMSGLAQFQGRYATNEPLVLAGALVSIAPVVLLYLSGQRFFVRGLTAGIGK